MTITKSDFQPPSTFKQPSLTVEKRRIAACYKDVLVGLLLLATPFLLFPQGYGLLALLVLPGLWLLRWALTGRIIPRTPLDWPILIILLMVLVSMGITFDLSFSIGKIAGLLLGIVLFYAVVDLADKESALKTVLTFFILSGMGIAVMSVLGTRWPAKFPFLQSVLDQLPEILRRVRNAEEGFNSNQVGGILIFFIPLQLMLGSYWLNRLLTRPSKALAAAFVQAEGSGWVKSLLGLMFVSLSLPVTAGVLLLTQSRGALGGLGVGLVALIASRTHWGKVLALVAGASLLWVIYSGRINDVVGPGLETDMAGTITLSARLEIWSRALQGLNDFPLGMGLNNFRRVMPILYPTISVSPSRDIAHAHNHLLQAGLDLGIPGLVAYLALWLGAGFLLYKVIREARNPLYRLTALGLAGGLVAHFTYGLTDAVALGAKPGFVFWWLLGLVVATYQLFITDQPYD
jgi:putative inorganic carbon (hco3(-)) transporter